MEDYADHFDILDDEHDVLDFTTEELNQFFTAGYLDTIMNEQYYQDEEQEEQQPVDEESEHMEIDQLQNDSVDSDQIVAREEGEKDLSQKFSQLSTEMNAADDGIELVNGRKRRLSRSSSPPSADVIAKKVKTTLETESAVTPPTHELERDLVKIPFNLSEVSHSFRQLVQQILGQVASSMTFDHIQDMALLIYRLALVNVHKEITMAIYKSGTGTLDDPESALHSLEGCVWPAVVQAALVDQQNTTDIEMSLQDRQVAYERLTYDGLQRLSVKTAQFEQEYREKRRQLVGLTSQMEVLISDYVQQMVVHPLILKRDLKIALLRYDYRTELIERKFSQENPNPYQIEVAQRLYKARENMEKVKRQLIELKQRIVYNRPLRSLHPRPVTPAVTAQSFNAQMQSIHQKQLDIVAERISQLERQLHEYKTLFNDEMSTMWKSHQQRVEGKCMPAALTDLISERSNNIVDQWREQFSFRKNYYLLRPFGIWDAMEQPSTNGIATEYTGFQPHMFIDTKKIHLFSDEQLRLLNRGPTYVPPLQMHLFTSSTDEILRKLYAPLKRQLARLLIRHKILLNLQFVIQNDLFEQFRHHFSTPVPDHLLKRAHFEKTLATAISETIRKNNLILRRTADQMNTFYLGDRADFERKVEAYLASSSAYELSYTCEKENYTQVLLMRVKKVTEFINNAIKSLRRRKDIDDELCQRLLTSTDQIKLSHFYFLPDTSNHNDVKVVPTVTSSHHHTIYRISQYLDELLRPFARDHMQPGTFHDEMDFIRQLTTYSSMTTSSRESTLTPTTFFCTIKVLNYFTLDTHVNMIDTICSFIQQNVAGNKLGRITIQTIKNLLQLCLCHTLVCYKKRLYQFVRGGPTTLPVMHTLANIYVFAWYTKIARIIEGRKEFFGRYRDELFLTWHGSSEDFARYIQIIAEKYPHIQLQTSIGLHVHYLNGHIANVNGQLLSRIYHDPNIQSYTLPYVVGHAKVQFGKWIRTALLRAACYCLSVEDFNRERIRIELACFASGYSYHFVESRVAHFYDHFRAERLRCDPNQAMYETWREKWFNQNDVQRALLHKQLNRTKTNEMLRFHYLYECGPRVQFQKQFQLFWLKYFHQHPILGREPMVIVLFTKHLQSLNTLLALR